MTSSQWWRVTWDFESDCFSPNCLCQCLIPATRKEPKINISSHYHITVQSRSTNSVQPAIYHKFCISYPILTFVRLLNIWKPNDCKFILCHHLKCHPPDRLHIFLCCLTFGDSFPAGCLWQHAWKLALLLLLVLLSTCLLLLGLYGSSSYPFYFSNADWLWHVRPSSNKPPNVWNPHCFTNHPGQYR